VEVVAPGDGWTPVSGARVEILDGDYRGVFCMTADTGRCELPPTFTASAPEILVSRDGYRPQSLRVVNTTPRVTTVRVVLTPASTPNVGGLYDLTVTCSDTCTGASDALRLQRNTATITLTGDWLSVTIHANAACSSMYGRVIGDTVELLGDVDCDFPRAPRAVALAALGPNRFLTGEGTWTGRWSEPALEVTLSGALSIEDGPRSGPVFTIIETCRAASHQLEFRRR
jgi:hypothetical protein